MQVITPSQQAAVDNYVQAIMLLRGFWKRRLPEAIRWSNGRVSYWTWERYEPGQSPVPVTIAPL